MTIQATPMMTSQAIQAPSFKQFLTEVGAIGEYVRYLTRGAALTKLPRGDGHPVIVYPGLMAGDVMTRPLRRTLARLGYPTHGWELGVNLGLKPGLLETMTTHVRRLQARYQRPVSLIGWSLGGLYARELARREPKRVRQVITLGTPFCGDPRANNAWRVYEWLNDHKVDAPPIEGALDAPPPVPTSSIYSPTDGIVAPACSLNPAGERVENISIKGTHMGLVCNLEALKVVAERLAQPEGEWRPYRAG